MYRIRRVDGNDDEIADTLKWMHTVCFGDSAPQIEPDLWFWWIAYLGREPCAFASMCEARATPNLGYLSRSGVFREHRGHGLQYRLIRVREALARKFGWTAMITDTTNNPASSNTLIKAGYRLYQPKHPWAFNCDMGQHSLYWEKDL